MVAGRGRSSLGTQPGAVTLLVLAIAGMAIADYLTAAHYTPLPLVCSTTGVIDCAQVTTSGSLVMRQAIAWGAE